MIHKPPVPPRKKRADGWSKETILAELSTKPEMTLRKLFELYRGEASAEACKSDYKQWVREDVAFAAAVKPLADLRRPVPSNTGRDIGRPPLDADPSNADWRLRFGEHLFKYGSRLKAAEKSPYKWTTILKKLNPRHKDFDTALFEIVREVELMICSEMEGGIVGSYRVLPDGKEKAQIARSVLERMDPDRWSKKVGITVGGKVEHVHSGQGAVGSGGVNERLLAILEDQTAFMRNSVKLIETGQNLAFPAPSGVILEAEVIQERFQPAGLLTAGDDLPDELEEELDEPAAQEIDGDMA